MSNEFQNTIKMAFASYEENTKNKQLKEIQDHNLNIFLKGICNVDTLKMENENCFNELEKPSSTMGLKEEDCMKIKLDFEACLHIHAQIRSMYKIRQYKYFFDKKK